MWLHLWQLAGPPSLPVLAFGGRPSEVPEALGLLFGLRNPRLQADPVPQVGEDPDGFVGCIPDDCADLCPSPTLATVPQRFQPLRRRVDAEPQRHGSAAWPRPRAPTEPWS